MLEELREAQREIELKIQEAEKRQKEFNKSRRPPKFYNVMKEKYNDMPEEVDETFGMNN